MGRMALRLLPGQCGLVFMAVPQGESHVALIMHTRLLFDFKRVLPTLGEKNQKKTKPSPLRCEITQPEKQMAQEEAT